MTKQTKLRTYEIVPNTNISFPIGTILTVEKLYDILDFFTVFSKHKKHSIDINRLLNISKKNTKKCEYNRCSPV
ncbi:Hypothetical protein Mbur_0460 [Methanococcoides burtonii DSM 6242]|uniref:Uncharacterized protein n=1 Tax=Methanococcoides burtonii (strain DSM 6242 / NBRC 107633 / OCM 468 / ACE-M) TaxID=259564 RepID=Q12YN1_METBU|nr:Hypothetical protein Mbur_0460 [Methanococcoides burtonii DSM 6242]